MNPRKILKLLEVCIFSLTSRPKLLDRNGPAFQNVTTELENCRSTNDWLEVNYKKICSFHNDEYYLKQATDHSLKEAFAREFAINNLGIMAPVTEWMYEKNGQMPGYFDIPFTVEKYIASKRIQNYVSASTLRPSLFRVFIPIKSQYYTTVLRATLSKIIGENEIAKLIAAGTFFSDLHMNNWGIANNKLVLIDVDTMPTTLTEFMNNAIWSTRFYLLPLGEITLENVKEMINIYENMKLKSLPKIHSSVDMSEQLYNTLLSAYIEACQYAIERIKQAEDGSSALIEGLRQVSNKYDPSFERALKSSNPITRLYFGI
jgi:hypothetical protein